MTRRQIASPPQPPHSCAPVSAEPGPAPDAVDPRAFGLIKAAYCVRETLKALSIGRTSLYEAVGRG